MVMSVADIFWATQRTSACPAGTDGKASVRDISHWWLMDNLRISACRVGSPGPPGKIYPRISFSYPVFIRNGCGYPLNILYIAVSDVSVLDINNITWWCPPTGSHRCGYHYDDHSVAHQGYHIFIRDGYMVIRYGYLLDNFQVSACAVYPPTGHPKIV